MHNTKTTLQSQEFHIFGTTKKLDVVHLTTENSTSYLMH